MIYNAIAQTGLDTTQCDLKPSSTGFRIEHKQGSVFEALLIENGLRSFLSIGTPKLNVSAYIKDGNYWFREVKGDLYNDILPSIRKWATEVKEVTEAPDLWDEVKRNREILDDIRVGESENTPFTQDEQSQIAAELQAIKQQIRDQRERFELTNEQIEWIDARFDEAEEASTRMGRKDWLLLFGGTILNLIVTDTITPSVAGRMFTMVVHGLAHLFTGGPPPQILS